MLHGSLLQVRIIVDKKPIDNVPNRVNKSSFSMKYRYHWWQLLSRHGRKRTTNKKHFVW